MVFSKEKKSLLPQKSGVFGTFLIALFTAAAIFVPYMIMDNGYFLFYGDFNVQQIPFYQHAHELIKSGTFMWDAGTDLGANFIGSYTFYLLGSPFFLLTLLLPNNWVPYSMGPLLILKFALAATAAFLYLRRFLRRIETARLCALLYAFSGFSVYNIFFNHFHEALIVFPLLLLAIELLITENRKGVFALAVFLAAAVNYFFFFGMVVFTVIYWFVRTLGGSIKITFGKFLSLVFEAVIGVGMAAAVLVPTIFALLGNQRLAAFPTGWNAFLYGKEQIYGNILECFLFPPDLPARPVFFPEANVKWSSLGGWLPLFSMVGVTAFWSSRKGNWMRRLIGICVFMALVPVLNSAFYMFNTAYYARWFYMPILIMCLMTGVAIEDRDINWRPAFLKVFSITAASGLIVALYPSKLENGKITEFGLYTKGTDATYFERFLITVSIAIVSLLVLRIIITFIRSNPKVFVRTATVFTVIVSVVYGSVFISTGKTHSYQEDTVMIPLIEEELTLGGNKDTYRIDCYECVDNTAMYFGYSGINAFHSIVPTSVTEFYKFIGEERSVASRPSVETYAARSLLSVRYLLDLDDTKDFAENGETLMPGYKLYNRECGYTVYENENYIPYGFTYDYYMTEQTAKAFGDKLAPNMMLKAIMLNKNDIKKYSGFLEELTVEKLKKSVVSEDDTDIIKTYDIEDDYQNDCAERKKSAAYGFTKTKDGFKADINLDSKNLVFFSIPYDKGFTAYINGKETEIVKANCGFCAVLAPIGHSEIVFCYRTPGLKLGIVISVGTLAVFLLYMIVCLATKNKPRKDCLYPEGEILLKRWEKDEKEEAEIIKERKRWDDDDDDDDCNFTTFTDKNQSAPFLPPKSNFSGGFRINTDIFEQKDIDKDGKP